VFFEDLIMKVINLEQNTPEWLAWRAGGIGASEASAIIGKNPYQTAYELFRVKAGFDEPDDLSNNPNVIRGNREEEGNRSRIEDKYGMVLLPLCGEHSEYPWMRVSLDGISSIDGTVVELKAPCESVYLDIAKNQWKSQAVVMYAIQVQHQLAVAGSDRGLLVFSYQGHDLEFPIQAKKSFQDKLIRAEEFFWNAVVKKSGIEPDPRRDFIPKDDDRFLQAASTFRGSFSMVSDLKEQLEEAETVMRKHKRALLSVAGSTPKVRGGGVQITRFENRGKVNYQAMYEALIRKNPELMNALKEDDFRTGGYSGTRVTLIDPN
jgi:putative phage-type endonuclease